MKQIEERKRKYKVDIPNEVISNINEYRNKYESYLKIHNNTSNKEVWKVYDHLTDDLFHELISQSMKDINTDLEDYLEKVIYDEFQMQMQ